MEELPIQLDLDNPEFQQAYQLLKNTNANIFLTGKAGTGKSTFLRYICKNLNKKYVILAPTGVAAVNVGGVTIHSFFQMPLRPVPPDDPEYSISSFKKSKKLSKRKIKLIRELELIIIDEVSMVRPDMIDFIDRILRAVKGNRREPFGGVQLLFVGDIFQLEPVVTNESKTILAQYYSDYFFFNARAYESAQLVAIELNKIYRQSDSKFIDLLDRVRLNRMTRQDFTLLNSRIDRNEYKSQEDDKFSITLATRRDTASAINSERLELLPGEETVFHGEINGEFPEKILPTDLELRLKVNAQVMLIRNDRDKRWVNGTIARVHKLGSESIQVELEDGRVEIVEKEEWRNINYVWDEKTKKIKEEVIGTFTQFPLKAAWAMTIHKSQGLTFNNVTIDMCGGAFSAGQTYVALSRCRSLEGLRFINPIQNGDVKVSRVAVDFSKIFNSQETIENALKKSRVIELSKRVRPLFDSGKYTDAIETLYEIDSLANIFSNSSVRRLLARALGIINKLKNELKTKNKLLRELSKEFTDLGEISIADKNNPDAAHRNYLKAYKLDPSNKEAKLGLARTLIILGEYKKASEILNEICKHSKSYSKKAHIIMGDMLREMKDFSNAAIHYQAAFNINRNDKDPIIKLINLYEEAGMNETADLYKKWLEEFEEN